MNFRVDLSDFGKVSALMSALGSSNRARLNMTGANVVAAYVKTHVGRYAAGKHATATALQASPTRHYETGRAGIVAESNAQFAAVVIPIPGISRALHDLYITPNGKPYLTIPKHRAAYGRKVATLRMRGWKIFRPGEKKCLLGYRPGQKPVLLYTLAESVHQRKDPTLLPSAASAAAVFASAVRQEVARRLRTAKKGSAR